MRALNALASYVTGLRQLLAGKTAVVDGQPTRMLHAIGLAEPRPIEVPLWVSVVGSWGAAVAGEVADGIIGPVHPTLRAAMIASGHGTRARRRPRVEPGSGGDRAVAGDADPHECESLPQRVGRDSHSSVSGVARSIAEG